MIKITKIKLLDSGFNSMEGHFWIYLYYFRIYNDDKNKYYNYKFVIFFTSEDLDEYRYDEEEDIYYDYDPKDYADDMAWSFIEAYQPTYENHNEFFEACNDSIKRYNERIAPDYDNSTIWGMACELARMTFGEDNKRITI